MKLRNAGLVLIIFLAGCSASHTANPNSMMPGVPDLSSDVNPFNLKASQFIFSFAAPWINNGQNGGGAITVGSDGNLWINGLGDIGSVTPTGTMTTYPANTGGHSIASSGSARWFDVGSGSAIGKITTSGTIHYYPLPTTGAFYVTKGPDGNVWFTEGNSKVGKITSAGVATEYDTGDTSSGTFSITTGPDGNLWFVDDANQPAVGRTTTSGVITEYPMPAGCIFDGVDSQIVKAPDGNLWVGGVCQSTLEIFRVTTSGTITAFPVAYDPMSMVVGQDKQLWGVRYPGILEEFNTSTHVMSNFIYLPHGPGISAGGITLGPDGNLWMTTEASNLGPSASRIDVYVKKVTTIGIRLNGELSLTDPNYGFELGYAVGTDSTQTQTISLSMGKSVQFKNVDTIPHSAAFLGNANSNSAPWPGSFNGSTTKSPAGTAIGTTGWATGSLNPNKASPIYGTGLPGFYMIGCQYHYNTNEMRTVIVVH